MLLKGHINCQAWLPLSRLLINLLSKMVERSKTSFRRAGPARSTSFTKDDSSKSGRFGGSFGGSFGGGEACPTKGSQCGGMGSKCGGKRCSAIGTLIFMYALVGIVAMWSKYDSSFVQAWFCKKALMTVVGLAIFDRLITLCLFCGAMRGGCKSGRGEGGGESDNKRSSFSGYRSPRRPSRRG